MKVLSRSLPLRRLLERWRRAGRTIGFVPTMGALHSAHLSLMEQARQECDKVIVSVFVNPTQFGPKEDLDRYPRPIRRDAALCRSARVDALYRPRAEDIYPPGFGTFVEVDGLSGVLCGASRPGHFKGVATVVLKLLQRTEPDIVFLGEKDYQQLVLLRRMVRDLDLPVRVIGCPTVREKDGLALSSRNAFLTPAQRVKAPVLYRVLRSCAAFARKKGVGPGELRRRMRQAVLKTPGIKIDYMEVVDADTLLRPVNLKGRMRLMGAIFMGNTRLIDNIAFTM